MSVEVVVAIIAGAFSFAGTIITVIVGNKLTLYRIQQLEKKQDKYNHLQERVAEMEIHDAKVDTKIEDIRGDIKDIKKKLFNEQ